MLSLNSDIICLVAQVLANDGCDPTFKKLSTLTTKSADLTSRLNATRRPVVFEFHLPAEEPFLGTVVLPICPESIFGSITVDWGDNTISHYHGDEKRRQGVHDAQEWTENSSAIASDQGDAEPLPTVDYEFLNRINVIMCSYPLRIPYPECQHPAHRYKLPGTYCVRVFPTDTSSRLKCLTTCDCNNDGRSWSTALQKFCSLGSVGIVSIKRLFASQPFFNLSLGHVDVSCCTNMESVFYNCSRFNQPLSSWNVGNVTNMRFLFYNAHSFNQSLASWDVSSVRDMTGMFMEAYSYNHPVNAWNVSKVQNMESMFSWAYAFNQPLNEWNVASVRNMRAMFAFCRGFNHSVQDWNMSSVRDISNMFRSAPAFNQSLRAWSVSPACRTANVFKDARDFNESFAPPGVLVIKEMPDLVVSLLEEEQEQVNSGVPNFFVQVVRSGYQKIEKVYRTIMNRLSQFV